MINPAVIAKIKHLSYPFPGVLKQLQELSKNLKVHGMVEQTRSVFSKDPIYSLILSMRTTEILRSGPLETDRNRFAYRKFIGDHSQEQTCKEVSETDSDRRSPLNCDAVTTKSLVCFIKSSQAEVFLQTYLQLRRTGHDFKCLHCWIFGCQLLMRRDHNIRQVRTL